MSLLMTLPLLLSSAAEEADYYTLQRYAPPQGEVLEVGGLTFLPDGRLAARTTFQSPARLAARFGHEESQFA